MNTKIIYIITLLILIVSGCTKQNNISGNTANINDYSIEIKGSDTLLQMVSNIAEKYSEIDNNAKISVTGGGSGTGIAALINGEIDLADSSREIKEKELRNALENNIIPLEFIIAKDMLSIVVNKNNPVSKLTMDEISKIYKGEITNWKEVGGPDMLITLYGRQSTSGTYIFFMEHVVNDDYSNKMRNMEGNQAILESIRIDESGIGYVGIGYITINKKITDEIGIVDVSKNGEYISPLDETKMSKYPISRNLYQYITTKPKEGTTLYNFLKFSQSKEGQELVKNSGYVPISKDEIEKNNKLFD